MPSTALVTGGNGFYGSHLSRRLTRDGWHTHVTSRRRSDDIGRGVQAHIADLANLDQARTIIETVTPDVIFHLAGSASAAPDADLVLSTYHSHVTSALNILTIARELTVKRIVLIGSLMEPSGNVADIVPSSPYSAAKLAVTCYGRMYYRLFNTPIVIVRPFMTFGPGQADSHVIPFVIKTFDSGRSPQLSSGAWRTDWIYVEDVIDGLMLAASLPNIEGQVIELGYGELRSVREVVSRIHEIMGGSSPPEFGALEDRPDEPVRVANIAVTSQQIGWAPQVDIDDGLRRTIAWYRDAN